MRIFIFKSEANRELGAFAHDPGGQELPSRFGPWHAVGVIRPDKKPAAQSQPRRHRKGHRQRGSFSSYRTKAKKVAAAS